MDIKIIKDKTNKMYVDKDNVEYAQGSNILSIINTDTRRNINAITNCKVIQDIIVPIICNKYDLNNTDKDVLNVIYKHYFNKKYVIDIRDFNSSYIASSCSKVYGKTKRLYQLSINKLSDKGIIFIDKNNVINLKDDYNFITENLNDITHVVITI